MYVCYDCYPESGDSKFDLLIVVAFWSSILWRLCAELTLRKKNAGYGLISQKPTWDHLQD